MAKKLTAKQRAFIDCYMVHKNATKAAIEAGYSEKTARAIGTENLAKPAIKEEIEKRLNNFTKEKADLKERVLERLQDIAFAKITDVANIDATGFTFKTAEQMTDGQAATIESISSADTKEGYNLKIKQKNSLAALIKIGDHLGLWTQGNDEDEDSEDGDSFDDSVFGTVEKLRK